MSRSLAVIGAAAVFQVAMAAQEAARPSPESQALKRLTFRNIGPTNQAGRVSVITGVPGDPYTFHVAGANGGVDSKRSDWTNQRPDENGSIHHHGARQMKGGTVNGPGHL